MPRAQVVPLLDALIGKRLRIVRRARGLTQKALAEKLHVRAQQIFKYEKGISRLSASQLILIARLLRVSLEYFLKDVPDDLRPPAPPRVH